MTLPHLANGDGERRERVRGDEELLVAAGAQVVLPHVPSWSRPVYHLYVVEPSSPDVTMKPEARAAAPRP